MWGIGKVWARLGWVLEAQRWLDGRWGLCALGTRFPSVKWGTVSTLSPRGAENSGGLGAPGSSLGGPGIRLEVCAIGAAAGRPRSPGLGLTLCLRAGERGHLLGRGVGSPEALSLVVLFSWYTLVPVGGSVLSPISSPFY